MPLNMLLMSVTLEVLKLLGSVSAVRADAPLNI